MSILSQMMTALRGGLSEAGEAVVDGQALRILDQEVRDAYEALKQSKDGLAGILAHQKLSEDKCATVRKNIQEHETYAIKALDIGDEALALEVAEKLVGFEAQLEHEQSSRDTYAASVDKLRTAVVQTERNLKRLKQQVDTVKATENVQRAQAAVAARHTGSQSKIRTAMDSLDRIKERQALKDAQMSSAAELSEEASDRSLQSKLEAAGITTSGRSVSEILDRLKKKPL